jgi:RNA polymerase sigma-70 factor (ECF subfamily)
MQHLGVMSGTVELLYREQGGRLWKAVLAYSGDRGIADEAVAETFAQLLRRGDAVRDPVAWVWSVAFRLAAREIADRRSFVDEIPDTAYEPEFADTTVLAAVTQLPERQRAAVVLHYYGDRPIKDVASALGMSPATVAVHLHRARKRLRQLLGEDVT